MKTDKQPDDFDYLAQQGFENSDISDEDIEEINKRVDGKVNAGVASRGMILTIVMFGLTILVSWLIISHYTSPGGKKFKHISQSAASVVDSNGSEGKLIAQAPFDSVITITSKIVHEHVVYPKEHFTKTNTDVHFDTELTAEVLPSHNITSVVIESTAPPQKEILEMLPNAAVIYIYDLKVTDYQKNYFKKSDPFTLNNGGLSSNYENIKGYTPTKNKEEPVYTADMVLKDALKAFNDRKYSESLSLFAILLDLNKKDVNALFYSALCNYHNNKAQQAIALLDKVLEHDNNVFYQEAEWYKALALIKNNDTDTAKELLLKINNRKGFYANSAGDKLKELK